LCDLKVEDFNYTECTITVRALKKGYVQSVPISKDLCINLKEYVNKENLKSISSRLSIGISGIR